MSRLRAALVHLAISALIGSALFAMVWFVWYPAPMLVGIGGHSIFLLLIAIDVVLGPLLTLIVFKSGKRSLKFDLAVIAALQLAAMTYGLSSLLKARPVYIAALGDKFQVIQAPEIADLNLKKAGKSRLPWFGPDLVGTAQPTDKFAVEEVAAVAQLVGGGLGHFPQFHVPYSTMRDTILAEARPISDLRKLNPGQVGEIDRWLASRRLVESRVKYQPIQISLTDYAVILDAKTAEVIGIAPFKPWP